MKKCGVSLEVVSLAPLPTRRVKCEKVVNDQKSPKKFLKTI